MKKSIKTILAALALATPLALTSCNGALDDIFGEWDKPSANTNTDSGSTPAVSNTYRVYTSGTAYTDETIPSGTTVTNTLTTWPAGTYIVNSDITIDDNVTITGDVNLIVFDGVTLTVNGYLGDPNPFAETYSLSIYGQSEGTGSIKATCTTADMATIDAKDLIIHGVVINASSTGNDGKSMLAKDNLVVYNSNITASATVGNAQSVETNGDLKIYNGTFVTSGMSQGIMATNTYIYGGDITASGGNLPSGQGGIGISGTLIISGGTVKANGGDAKAASAQPGGEALGGTVTFNGGTLTATGGAGDAPGADGLGVSGYSTITVATGYTYYEGPSANPSTSAPGSAVDGDGTNPITCTKRYVEVLVTP